ncbi:TIGR01621 family pseudouridine synthase [Bowmanella sp. Y26]|uniref:TIGR01621 family pseudouridine synthase n=1 Tax=Bowmanella yangjiangensis TaxID=2811230 RepID=UPI001BDBDA81|nr:TIGR01621 family pseudouridine synthase [Bowmanella yangjiangensis]MBT1062960.1 TIGR01621 family pseudouridine synthase [Bowmanella yangjiangensis]
MISEVLYEHDDFLVIDKPAGIGMHQEAEQPGIVTLLSQQLGGQPLWPVHRLDKVTSGALLLAKNAEAAALLSGQFAERQVEKFYLALSDKKPNKKQGAVIGDMQKARRGQWKLLPSKLSPAISQFFSSGLGNGLRLFIIKPRTGKTHQIRVMLKSLGSAILGDSLYAGTPSDRTYLHAFALQFEYQGQQHQIVSVPGYGQYFTEARCQQALQDLLSPWQLPWPHLNLKRTAL